MHDARAVRVLERREHSLDDACGLGDGQRVQVDIARRLFDATVTLGPLFDREGARMKP